MRSVCNGPVLSSSQQSILTEPPQPPSETDDWDRFPTDDSEFEIPLMLLENNAELESNDLFSSSATLPNIAKSLTSFFVSFGREPFAARRRALSLT
jgi:hypothetical protein